MWSQGIRHHQSINGVALKKLGQLTSVSKFPTKELMDKFEGENGPDSVKAKRYGHDTATEYYDPFDDEDVAILEDIEGHYSQLVENLKKNNIERAAFEAAWLAHVLVDGLTPAHHFPYNETLESLGGDEAQLKQAGSGVVRVVADRPSQTLKQNWKIWGAKGIVTTHTMFEGGVAAISAPLSYAKLEVSKHDVQHVKDIGLNQYFMQEARAIAVLRMYDRFYSDGWTTRLAMDVRDELMPRIIKTVTIAWYLALNEAGLTSRPKK